MGLPKDEFAATDPAQSVPPWGLGRRILFRFACAYFLLYGLPFPLSAMPGVAMAVPWFQRAWDAVVPWVGQHVFHLTISVRPNGSGDTTYNYVQVFCFLVLAAAVTAVWSLLDRKRPHYERAHRWLRVYLRFLLATTMFSYGSVKLIPTQFPAPSLSRLARPFGEASPMGLLWTFMGASGGYTAFTGAAEILGALLLTTRRTTLLGALVCVGVLGNVFMLNMCYDVPVKLFSAHLLAMAVFLTLHDRGRLANLFLRGRPAGPVSVGPPPRRPWLHRGALALRTVLVLAYAGMGLYGAYQYRTTRGDGAPKPPLYGLWEWRSSRPTARSGRRC